MWFSYHAERRLYIIPSDRFKSTVGHSNTAAHQMAQIIFTVSPHKKKTHLPPCGKVKCRDLFIVVLHKDFCHMLTATT